MEKSEHFYCREQIHSFMNEAELYTLFLPPSSIPPCHCHKMSIQKLWGYGGVKKSKGKM